MRVAIDKAALTAATVLAADQATKSLSFSVTSPGERIRVLPGVSISETHNEGIAFGMLSGRPGFVLALMFTALAVLVWFYVHNRGRPVLWLATGMLMGGALGNAIDRLSLGYVRDFIDLPSWPAFNLADAAITVGVVVLVFSADMKIAADKRRPGDERHAD